MRLELGRTYRTSVAEWTVIWIACDGMVKARREDGLEAWFGYSDLLDRVIECIR